MVSVPHRLLDLPTVERLYADADLVVLRKRVTCALYERPTYVAMHALTLVQEGQQVLYDEAGRALRVRPGQIGMMRRGLYGVTDLLADMTGGFATVVVFFSDALLRECLPVVEVPNSGTDLCAIPAVGALCDWVSTLPQNPPRGDASSLKTVFRESFRGLIAGLASEGGVAAHEALCSLLETRRRPIRELMSAHYDKPLTLLDYAVLSGRSERSFRRDFKARFGESPKRWLVARRLERARELLNGGEDRVAVVAQAVGYVSTSHFIGLYKQRYGVTPGRDLVCRLRYPPP